MSLWRWGKQYLFHLLFILHRRIHFWKCKQNHNEIYLTCWNGCYTRDKSNKCWWGSGVKEALEQCCWTINSAATMESIVVGIRKTKNEELKMKKTKNEGPSDTRVWHDFSSLQWYESKKHSIETIPWIWSFPGLAVGSVILFVMLEGAVRWFCLTRLVLRAFSVKLCAKL